MRINYGKYKSKIINAVKGSNTRPTADKIRESMFDILNNRGLVKGNVLDLFAGSGALGIEAVSRGCESAVFIEKNPEAAKILRQNVSFVKEHTEVYNTDWQVAVRKLKGKQFDIIFLDPPYALKIESKIIAQIEEKDILSSDGVIVIEHDKRNILDIDCSKYDVTEKVYSTSTVTFITKVKKQPLCVFPGSFDPITNGHIALIDKALNAFDKVIVAVAKENYKESLPAGDRAFLAEKAINGIYGNNSVCVKIFDGNLTDFLKENECFEIVRGVRNDADLLYEENLLKIYREMDPRVNMHIYITGNDISSSMVRNAAASEVAGLVPDAIFDDVIRMYNK